eukprot:TRINITY_DN16958_c0_g1_i1.p1 TRINITY_DN16958_c0_g1~~TRINITY_DN16958_c0_g1_i1.p1  ORF type:complete len:912 (-),score=194.04 TRINITY_DN16958_c0_g1_i1:135-2870(-)
MSPVHVAHPRAAFARKKVAAASSGVLAASTSPVGARSAMPSAVNGYHRLHAGPPDDLQAADVKKTSSVSLYANPDLAREETEFRWMQRNCYGNKFHQAVLDGEVDAVRVALDVDADVLTSRFKYYTVYQGKRQEGTGEAIHLAASRDVVEMVELLISRKARLDAMVTRDGQSHYDVLHAAVFAEGKGGHPDVVQTLLEAKAPMTRNLAGEWPLHKAFQTNRGINLISMLRAEMALRGGFESIEKDIRDKVPTPLQYGVRQGRFTEEELASNALLQPESLQVFMEEEPLCIRPFLDRLQQSENFDADGLAEHVTVQDVAKVLRQDADAAHALLLACTSEPYVANPGWNPLPRRISFAERNWTDKVRNILNPPNKDYTLMMNDNTWAFDAVNMVAPEWQKPLTDRSAGRPIRDVKVSVCNVPGLACAEFFSALDVAASDENCRIYDNPVVRGVLDRVWWKGACKVDILQFMLTAWGLALLILDSSLCHILDEEDGDDRRLQLDRVMLKGHHHHGDYEVNEAVLPCKLDVPLSGYFVCARGIVDLLHEIAQCLGAMKIGRGQDYLNAGNLFDMVRCAIPMMYLLIYLRLGGWDVNLNVIVILLYWQRLLECNFSERLSQEILPIVRLARGLVPATAVAIVGFLAFAHGRFVLEPPGTRWWPDNMHKSFEMLITAALPSASSSDANLMFSYVAVLAFAVFFLNIFIGVIGENYIQEKGDVRRTFQEVRGGICLTFLLRARVIPCGLMSEAVGYGLIASAFVVAMSCQVASRYLHLQLSHIAHLGVLVLCQGLVLLGAYQTLKRPTDGLPSDEKQNFLWLALPIENEEKSEELSSISDKLSALTEKLESLEKSVKGDRSETVETPPAAGEPMVGCASASARMDGVVSGFVSKRRDADSLVSREANDSFTFVTHAQL